MHCKILPHRKLYVSKCQLVGDKVWMYKERMMNNDNLEYNLLTSSLLKKMSGLHTGTSLTRILCTGNLPLQVNYAERRLQSIVLAK